MNRLSINAKKDEKSPYPLENNELGMNFNFSKIVRWRYRAGTKVSGQSGLHSKLVPFLSKKVH